MMVFNNTAAFICNLFIKTIKDEQRAIFILILNERNDTNQRKQIIFKICLAHSKYVFIAFVKDHSLLTLM